MINQRELASGPIHNHFDIQVSKNCGGQEYFGTNYVDRKGNVQIKLFVPSEAGTSE